MSTTPAFSPGPCTTSLPRVGSRFRCTLLDLYEQCSLHITEKIPSSVMFGSRPSICLTRAYSSAGRPCSAAISAEEYAPLRQILRRTPPPGGHAPRPFLPALFF